MKTGAGVDAPLVMGDPSHAEAAQAQQNTPPPAPQAPQQAPVQQGNPHQNAATANATSFLEDIHREVQAEMTGQPQQSATTPQPQDNTPLVDALAAQSTAMTQTMATMQQSFAESQKHVSDAIAGLATALGNNNAAPSADETYRQQLEQLALTKEQEEQFGQSIPVIEQIARRAALTGDTNVMNEIAGLKSELAKRDVAIAQLRDNRTADNQVAFIGSMSSVTERPREVVSSSEFREWLATPNPDFVGMAPQTFWDPALQGNDTELGTRVMSGFLGSELGSKFSRPGLSEMSTHPAAGQGQMPGAGAGGMTPGVVQQLQAIGQEYLHGSKQGQIGEYNAMLRKALEKMNRG